MKKIYILLFSIACITGCSDNKEKTKTEDKSTSVTTGDATKISGEDESIKTWLQQKEWKAENGAPISQMKLHADGRVEYSTANNDQWSYSNGLFGIHMGGGKKPTVTWPVKKIDENSFTLYVEPTQKTYTYTFVGNL